MFKTSTKKRFSELEDIIKKITKLPLVDWNTFHSRIMHFAHSVLGVTSSLYEEQQRMEKELKKLGVEINEINKKLRKK